MTGMNAIELALRLSQYLVEFGLDPGGDNPTASL